MRIRARVVWIGTACAVVATACVVVVGMVGAAEGAAATPVEAGSAQPAPKPAPASGAPAPAAPKPKAQPKPQPKAQPKPAPKAAPKPVQKPAGEKAVPVEGTPCTSSARACVDLDAEKAWLIDDGKVVRGPVDIVTGDDEDPTPVGTFKVQWKAKEYTSREYLTQMPYSVFFADGGIAFHEGNPDNPSAGCVKLDHDNAVAWFDFLQVGDEVQIH